MKSLLPYLLIFKFLILSAQLSVSNDHFIYVDNQVVYVEDDVNIENTDSKIYFRNDGQLLQGNGSTGNSGVGKLSIQQSGSASVYQYNYWCSPVGNTTSNSNANIPSKVSQLHESTGTITAVSVGFTSDNNGLLNPLTISNRWLYTLKTASNVSDWNRIGSNNDIDTGLGFTFKGATANAFNVQQYEFRGKPNNGTITNDVGNGYFTLIGNPYPSALDALAFIHDSENKNNIHSSLYFWEQDNIASHNLTDYSGGYATYTISEDGSLESFVKATFNTYNIDGTPTSEPATASNSTKQVKRYIPVGQGFLVLGIANGTVRTTNNQRAYYKQSDSESEFFRNSNTKNKTNIYSKTPISNDIKRFRVYVDFNDVYTRELMVNFHPSATSGSDRGLEAKSPFGAYSDAYLFSDNEFLVIQAFNFNEVEKIPLILSLNENQTIRIRIDELLNFSADTPIYLHDIEEDTYLDLTANDGFEISLDQGYYDNKYEITFTNKITLTNSEVESSLIKILQNNEANKLTILNSQNLNLKKVKLYDILGKSILDFDVKSIQGRYEYSTKHLQSGIYIVKITLDGEPTITKKIVINN